MSLAADLGLGRHKSGYACAIGVWRRKTKDDAPSVAGSGTAGGAPQHTTFFNNPQFELVLEGAAQQRLEIKLDHVMINEAVPGKGPCAGFVVLNASASGKRRTTLGIPGGAFGYSAICAVCPPTFTPGGDASAWLKLERLEAPYIIVPCARDPGHEGIFALRVRSNFAVRLRLLPSKASDNAAALAALEDEFELDQSTEGEPITEAAMKQPLALEMPATTDAAVDRVLRSLRGHDGLFKDETTETLLAPPSNAPLLVRWRRPSQLQWQQEGQPSLPFGASPTPVFLSPAPNVPANLPSWGESSAPSSTPPSAEDMAAGSWLLGALAILAQRPQVVDRCFVQGSHLQRGVLAVRVWDWNRWRTIVTDDRLATVSGRVVYGACEEEADLRFAFLIKAYASLHGSLAALRNGRITELLVDLTGGLPHKIEIAAYESASAETRAQQLELLWHELAELQSSGALLGCGQDAEKEGGGRAQRLGVRPRSTYALLQLVQMGAHRLVCVRNPWGAPAFSGRWSAGAAEWIALQHEGRWPIEMLQAERSPYAFAAVASAGTGVTWMDWADFLESFDRIYACRLPSPEKPFKVIYGEWDSESSGGCLNHLTSWRRNPQMLLDLPRGGRLFACLSQPPRLGPVHERGYAAIGFCVLRGDGRRRLLHAPHTAMLGASPITDARDVSLSITLPPSELHAPHVLVPYTFEPGEQGPFKLSVWSSAPFEVSPLSHANEWQHVCVDGAWDASSGGVPNAGNDYWRNPQWELAPTPHVVCLRIILELHPAPAAAEASDVAIGCLLLRGDAGSDSAGGIQLDDVLAQAGFAMAVQVSCNLTLPASTKPRRLLVCTFHPGQQANFQLHLYSDKPLELTALPIGPPCGTGFERAGEPRPESSPRAHPDSSAAVGPSAFSIDPLSTPYPDTTATYLHNEIKNLRSELQTVQEMLAENAVRGTEHLAAREHKKSTPFRKVARFLSGRQH